MRLQIVQQFFIRQYGLSRPLVEYREIVLVFAESQQERVVDDLRNGLMGRCCLDPKRPV
jgi:hypothetical protein